MSGWTPTQVEKALAQRFLDAARRLDKLEYDTPTVGGMWIASYHAVQGVRCNGIEKLVGLMDCSREMDDYIREAQQQLVRSRCILKIALRQRLLLRGKFDKHFRICPKCKGKQGTGRCDCPDDRWEDCYKCDGLGYVDK